MRSRCLKALGYLLQIDAFLRESLAYYVGATDPAGFGITDASPAMAGDGGERPPANI